MSKTLKASTPKADDNHRDADEYRFLNRRHEVCSSVLRQSKQNGAGRRSEPVFGGSALDLTQ
jgi:hypothetical protein